MKSVLPSARALLGLGAMYLFSAAAAGQGCDPSLAQSIGAVQRIVESLHATKPGQFRVAAVDGSEHSAEHAQWMQGQLRLINEACMRGGDVEAAWRLEQVQETLSPLRRAGSVRHGCQATSRFDATCMLSADARMGRRTMNVEPTPSRLSAITSP